MNPNKDTSKIKWWEVTLWIIGIVIVFGILSIAVALIEIYFE